MTPKTSDAISIGTGGNPLSTEIIRDRHDRKLSSRESAVHRIEELGLNHMEIEFVRGVNISEENAINLGQLAKQKNISLTVHGPYYINLASKEKPKIHASMNRIKKTLQAAEWMDAKSITFHAAFYQGRKPEEITKQVIDTILQVLNNVPQAVREKILVSPETTGKHSQWGTIDEILEAAYTINQQIGKFQASICVDFAHIFARSGGEINSHKQFAKIIDEIEAKLGKQAIQNLHMHMSGIEYGEKGEKKHLILEKSELKYKEILKMLKEKNVGGWLTCESPNLEEDAVRMKKEYMR